MLYDFAMELANIYSKLDMCKNYTLNSPSRAHLQYKHAPTFAGRATEHWPFSEYLTWLERRQNCQILRKIDLTTGSCKTWMIRAHSKHLVWAHHALNGEFRVGYLQGMWQ